jgi:hypothetical protein
VFGSSTQSGWGGFDEIGYIYYTDGYGDVCVSEDLKSLYEANDVRQEVFVPHHNGEYPGFVWPGKYPGKEQIRVNNIVVLRLAEMYLIRAEAILKGASVSGATALGDYNAIRTNRGLTAAGTVSLEDVWNERRRELCFEGSQLWDLSRTGRGLERSDYSGAGDANIPFPDYRWAMPIPATEMDRNPNMEQNPGY